MTQIVIMLYEDPTKDPGSEERFHVELHFSPGVNCCVDNDLPPGPGFRPNSRNNETTSMCEAVESNKKYQKTSRFSPMPAFRESEETSPTSPENGANGPINVKVCSIFFRILFSVENKIL